MTLIPGQGRGGTHGLELPFHQLDISSGAQVDLGDPLVGSDDNGQVLVLRDEKGEGLDVWKPLFILLCHPVVVCQDGPGNFIEELEGCAHQVDPLLEWTVYVLYKRHLG